ncbi:alpha/beta fold hydrolase [Nonomuraea sp. NPDC050556]|uniref:alpha/beta fold hydrolase n=1 Tax=Nonomuraea sp. NPDC050556 TaxID=3364369 RepID=UPI0037AC5DEB
MPPFGMMSKRVPHEVSTAWFRPLWTRADIRRDLLKYIRSPERRHMVESTEKLRTYQGPALVVWASEDRVMPPDHGRRLAALLPDARLVEIPDSYTLIPEDQPGPLSEAIREFLSAHQS